MRPRLTPVLVLPLVLAAGVACSTPAGGPRVASVNSGSTAPSPAPSLSLVEQGRRHAQCMRDHGVPEADPKVQPNGDVHLGGGYDKKTLDQDVLRKAIDACKPYEAVLSGPDAAAKAASAREYAKCMRAHGVENFPDPGPDGRFTLPDEQTDPDYDQARATCRAAGPSAASS